jgi:hypothetical protein
MALDIAEKHSSNPAIGIGWLAEPAHMAGWQLHQVGCDAKEGSCAEIASAIQLHLRSRAAAANVQPLASETGTTVVE